MAKSQRTRRTRRRKLPAGMWQRGGVYYANFRSGGQHIRRKLSRDFDTAKKMLNELRSRADKGTLGLIDNKYPWDDLRAEFIEDVKQRLRTWTEYVKHLDQFERFRKVKCVSEIDKKYALDYRRMRLKTISRRGKPVTGRTINKEIATLKSMLNSAVKDGKIARNPLAGFGALESEPTKKRRALELHEVEAIFKHSPRYLRSIWRAYMTTGCRRKELVELQWSDVDLDDGTITIRAANAKGKKERVIPLDETLLVELPKMERRSGHVFVNSAGTPCRNNLLREFYRICKRAGIEDGKPNGSVDIHSLRVTSTTLSLDHGANPKAVQDILGHSTLELTMNTYAKATDRGKRDAVSALPFAQAKTPDHVVPMKKRGA